MWTLRGSTTFVLCGLVLVAQLACEDRSSTSGVASPVAGGGTPQPLPDIEQVQGEGSVRGTVLFVGTPPVMKVIQNEPCHSGAGSIIEETVVVGENGGLANVLVYIEGAPAVDGSTAEPGLLDQIDCRYVPHVLGVQVNQPLRIRSSDPTLHNVHYNPKVNPPVNFGMNRAGQEKTVSFKAPEFIPVRCDVHPWMNAHIGVFDNPFFAVTAGDGNFEIKNLPDGQYTLATWHERYGRLEREIEIIDGEAVEAGFEYKAPS
jgi:hypothetical protein